MFKLYFQPTWDNRVEHNLRQVDNRLPKKKPGSWLKNSQNFRQLLEVDLEARPAATLSERLEFLERVCGLRGTQGKRLDGIAAALWAEVRS